MLVRVGAVVGQEPVPSARALESIAEHVAVRALAPIAAEE